MKHFHLIAALAASTPLASAQNIVPGFDFARIGYSQTGEMDMGGGNGSVEVSRFEARSIVSRPLSPAPGLFILPMAEYQMTDFNFDGAPLPFRGEELHALSLSAFGVSMSEDSPWIYGGWARAEMASDFQHIDDDDFTFDLAAGAGYRFNESFTLAFGAAVINLNGDAQIYPGIGFDWIINDQVRAGLYGPMLTVAWAMNEDWLMTFRGDPGGGVWNVTGDAGETRSIDFSSYRLGLYASRRIAGELWLTAGGGVTVGNELDYTTPNGREILSLEPDEGIFGTIGLRLKAW